MLADLHPGLVYSSILRSGTDHSELDPLPTISKKKIDPPNYLQDQSECGKSSVEVPCPQEYQVEN